MVQIAARKKAKAQAEQTPLNLAQKGAFFLAIPVTIQFFLLIILFLFSLNADNYARHIGEMRDRSSSARNLVMENSFLVLSVEYALLFNQGTDPRLGTVREKQVTSAEILAGTYAAEPDKLALVEGIVKKTATLLYEADRARLNSSLSKSLNANNNPFGVLRLKEDALLDITNQLAQPLLVDLPVESRQDGDGRRLLFIAAVVGTILNLLILFVLAIIFNRGITGRISLLCENAERLARGQKLLPPIGGDDEIAELDRNFHTMTEKLKETERTERTIFENIDCVLCAVDKLGRFQEVNAAAARVFRRSPQELAGMYIEDLVPPEERKQAIERISEAVCDGSQKPFELPIVRGNDRIYTLWSARFVPERNLVFCVVQDVTEHQEAERVKKEVLHMVTHDLRNPLSTIGLIYFMLDSGKIGAVAPEGHRALAAARASSSRLLTIVNNLLDVEKMEAGMLELEFENLDISQVANKAMAAVAQQAFEKKIKLSDECFKVIVRADRFRLEQILVNLLLNAIKFAPENSTVVVGTQPGNGYLRVSVSDCGPGIPVEKQRHLFDRFAAGRASGERIGLGLSICRALARLHGGEIAVESAPGRGSTFYFSLPYGDKAGA